MIKLYLIQQKIKFFFQELKEVKTSRCCIGILEENKNKIYKVNQIRASALLDKKYVQSIIENILESEMLFIEGYFVLGKYDIIEYLLSEYDKSGRKIAFNVSSAFICEKKREEVKMIFNHSDLIFATKEEVEKFLNKSFESDLAISKSLHESLESKTKKRYLILIKGNSNCLITSYDYDSNFIVIEFENEEKSEKIIARDTSGTREGNTKFAFYKDINL